MSDQLKTDTSKVANGGDSLSSLSLSALIEMLGEVGSAIHARLAQRLSVDRDCTTNRHLPEWNRRKRRLEKAFEQVKAAEVNYRLVMG